jgi:hypothetical protein
MNESGKSSKRDSTVQRANSRVTATMAFLPNNLSICIVDYIDASFNHQTTKRSFRLAALARWAEARRRETGCRLSPLRLAALERRNHAT